MNQAHKDGKSTATMLQKLFTKSDMYHDPQALILAPNNVIIIAGEMVKGNGYIDSAVRAGLKGLEIIEEAYISGEMQLSDMEVVWIESIREGLSDIPTNEGKFIEQMLPSLEGKFIPSEYGL
jgi:hypothetical protein